MNADDIMACVKSEIDQTFHLKGYQFRQSNGEYVRKAESVNYIYRLNISKRTDWYQLFSEVYVGIPKVNRLFNKILGRNLQINGPTFGYGIANYTGHERGKYTVDGFGHLRGVASSLVKDYEDYAQPFFDTMNSVPAISTELQQQRTRKQVAHSVSGACLSLITMHLSGHNALHDEAVEYYDYWCKSQGPAVSRVIMITQEALEEI